MSEKYRGHPKYLFYQYISLRRVAKQNGIHVKYGLKEFVEYIKPLAERAKRLLDRYGRMPSLHTVDKTFELKSLVFVDRRLLRALRSNGVYRKRHNKFYAVVPEFDSVFGWKDVVLKEKWFFTKEEASLYSKKMLKAIYGYELSPYV